MLVFCYGILLKEWLEKQNKVFKDLNPIERLCYVGKRGMGALEFEPAEDLISNSEYEVDVDEMLEIARKILKEANQEKHSIDKNKNLIFLRLQESVLEYLHLEHGPGFFAFVWA